MDGEDWPKEMYFFYESLSEIILLWMEEILHQLGGAGFIPSTVWLTDDSLF